eukprot:GHVU01143646.1.p1 GENE.GHVU01143646.1~~GHVU01143646.1.p1  ORF type:complete len:287 (+),score=26.72 GHVU01143646.1:102-962(+)
MTRVPDCRAANPPLPLTVAVKSSRPSSSSSPSSPRYAVQQVCGGRRKHPRNLLRDFIGDFHRGAPNRGGRRARLRLRCRRRPPARTACRSAETPTRRGRRPRLEPPPTAVLDWCAGSPPVGPQERFSTGMGPSSALSAESPPSCPLQPGGVALSPCPAALLRRPEFGHRDDADDDSGASFDSVFCGPCSSCCVPVPPCCVPAPPCCAPAPPCSVPAPPCCCCCTPAGTPCWWRRQQQQRRHGGRGCGTRRTPQMYRERMSSSRTANCPSAMAGDGAHTGTEEMSTC